MDCKLLIANEKYFNVIGETWSYKKRGCNTWPETQPEWKKHLEHGENYHSRRKIPYFHLISWCENFVEKHSFRIVWANRPKLCGNCAFAQNLHTSKLGEIEVFYAVTFPENIPKQQLYNIVPGKSASQETSKFFPTQIELDPDWIKCDRKIYRRVHYW